MSPRIDTADNSWERFSQWLSRQVSRLTEASEHVELNLYIDDRQLGIDWEADQYQVRVHLETSPDDWDNPASVAAAKAREQELLAFGWSFERDTEKAAAFWLVSPETAQQDAAEISTFVVGTLTRVLAVPDPGDLEVKFSGHEPVDWPTAARCA